MPLFKLSARVNSARADRARVNPAEAYSAQDNFAQVDPAQVSPATAKSPGARLTLSCLALGALLLCACSLEDEYEEKIIEHPEETETAVVGDEFVQACSRCVQGEVTLLAQLGERYLQSFNDRKSPERFTLQDATHTQIFERCVNKAYSAGVQDAYQYVMSEPRQLAIISRHFYAQNAYSDGAFWLRRLINLVGQSRAYETAGGFFLRRKETAEAGARMLAESARLGNRQAASTIWQYINDSEFRALTSGQSEDTTALPSESAQERSSASGIGSAQASH